MKAREVTGSGQSAYFSHNGRDLISGISFAKASGVDYGQGFSYNGAGERVVASQTEPGEFGLTTFVTLQHDGSKVIREATDGTLNRRYRHNDQAQDAMGSLIEIAPASGPRLYPCFDQRGTVWRMPDEDGELRNTYLFDVFGNKLGAGEETSTNPRLRFLTPGLFRLNLSNLEINLTPGRAILAAPALVTRGASQWWQGLLLAGVGFAGEQLGQAAPPPLGPPPRDEEPQPWEEILLSPPSFLDPYFGYPDWLRRMMPKRREPAPLPRPPRPPESEPPPDEVAPGDCVPVAVGATDIGVSRSSNTTPLGYLANGTVAVYGFDFWARLKRGSDWTKCTYLQLIRGVLLANKWVRFGEPAGATDPRIPPNPAHLEEKQTPALAAGQVLRRGGFVLDANPRAEYAKSARTIKAVEPTLVVWLDQPGVYGSHDPKAKMFVDFTVVALSRDKQTTKTAPFRVWLDESLGTGALERNTKFFAP